MTSNDLIRGQPGDVKRLAAEVAELKGVLRDISQQLRRIERRIDAVLPAGERSGKFRKTNGAPHAKKHVAISEAAACQLVKELTETLRHNQGIESRLRDMTVKNELTAIARFLGMTNTKLPPKTELIGTIVTRLRQSIMLTENIDAIAADNIAEKPTRPPYRK